MDEEELKRRKRVSLIKKIIIITVVVLLLLPTCLCVLLLFKVHQLENEVDEYKEEVKVAVMNKKNNSEGIKVIDDAIDVALSIDDNSAVDESQITSEDNTSDIDENNKDVDSENTDKNADDNSGEVKEEKRIYLTFDDGPSIYTATLLDTLAEYNVKATFFINGKTSDEDKALIKRMYDEGHTVGMHSYSHDYDVVYSSVSSFTRDFKKISKLIEDVTGEKPKYYRFPGGSSTTRTDIDIQEFIDVLDENGVSYYDWNAANMDATGVVLTEDELIDNILDGVKNNNTSVVLMHDTAAKKTTIDSMPKLIEELQKAGYTILPIDEETPLVRHIQDANDNSN